jgi:hypothetical protein
MVDLEEINRTPAEIISVIVANYCSTINKWGKKINVLINSGVCIYIGQK